MGPLNSKYTQMLSGLCLVVLLCVVVGTVCGWIACVVFSAGQAEGHFYLTYGAFGAIVGLLGSPGVGLIVLCMRISTVPEKRSSPRSGATTGLEERAGDE